jgi:hypothetical protein
MENPEITNAMFGALHVIFKMFQLVMNIEIGIELCMFIYFLAILMGQIYQKLNYRLVTYKLTSS